MMVFVLLLSLLAVRVMLVLPRRQNLQVLAHKFSRETCLSVLVLVASESHLSCNKNARSLFQLQVLDVLGHTAPKDNVEPVGIFLAFAVVVLVGFRNGNGKRTLCFPAWEIAIIARKAK